MELTSREDVHQRVVLTQSSWVVESLNYVNVWAYAFVLRDTEVVSAVLGEKYDRLEFKHVGIKSREDIYNTYRI